MPDPLCAGLDKHSRGGDLPALRKLPSRPTGVYTNDQTFRHSERHLFLAQKVEVCVAAGSRIDDGGEVLGEIVGVTISLVLQWENEGNL
jgi:hypothetical protein